MTVSCMWNSCFVNKSCANAFFSRFYEESGVRRVCIQEEFYMVLGLIYKDMTRIERKS